MTTTALLTENVPEDPVFVERDATVFPSGVFAGAHIVLLTATAEEGDYHPSEYYYSSERKNLLLAGGGWVKAEVGNSQPDTDLSLSITTPS